VVGLLAVAGGSTVWRSVRWERRGHTAAPWPRAHAPNSTVHKELTMRLAEDMRVEEDYRGAACDFLDRLCGQTGCY